MATEPPKKPLVDALAWQIWSAKAAAVRVADPERRSGLDSALRTGILIEDESGIKFSDQSAMIEAAARHLVSSELTDLTDSPQRCFERLSAVQVEETGTGSVSGHVLALLHNSGQIDAFSWGQQALDAGSNYFAVLEIFEGAIPHFSSASPKSIISFASHHELVKNNFGGGKLFRNLDQWFSVRPEIAKGIKELHLKDKQGNSANIYRSALQGLVLNDFSSGFNLLIEATKSEEPLVSSPAIHALGLIDFGDASRSFALAEAVEVCRDVIAHRSDASLAAAVGTLCSLLVFDERIAVLLIQAARTGVPEALYRLSEFLLRNAKTYHGREWFGSLLRSLTVANLQHKGILSNVDMLLMDCIDEDSRTAEVVEFLSGWICNQNLQDLHAGAVEGAFPNTVSKIRQKSNLLSLILTTWLLKDDLRFPLAVNKLLPYLQARFPGTLHLDRVTVDGLSSNELRFLVRRLLGFLTGDEILIPLVFSLVYTRDASRRTLGLMANVFVNQIGYDYPSRTIEYLIAQQNLPDNGKEVKELCRQIISNLESHLGSLRDLPNLKELRPQFFKVRRFQKERHRQMNEAFEDASKDSFWRKIATHIPLKAGRRTFQMIRNRYTDPIELKAVSHSATIPTSAITDPVGEGRQRALFRRANRLDP